MLSQYGKSTLVPTAVGTLALVLLGARAACRSFGVKKERALGDKKAMPHLNMQEIYQRHSKIKVKKSILYTRTGDKGSSALYNGERRSKEDAVFEALGTCDELNAVLGVAREHCIATRNGMQSLLEEIQSRLLDVGAAIATPKNKSSDEKLSYTRFPARCTKEIECAIDELDSHLPPLTTFILPSGGHSAAALHVARVVCRRAERRVMPLVEGGEVDAEVGRYLNRLSDFFFAAARYAAFVEGFEEATWHKMAEEADEEVP
ncbi:unnamed protein product [Chrysoparadoxa australica]